MGERHMKETAAGARTKQLLTDSLRHLMEKKPLNQISVKEITDGCGMQRQTFYYHFHDVYDQLKWAYQQQIAVLFSEHQEESWQESLLRLFHYVEKNRGICRSILESVGREPIRRVFYQDVHRFVRKAMQMFYDTGCDQVYLGFTERYLSLAFGSVLESWVLGEIRKTPEEVVAYVDILIQDQARGAKERALKKALTEL